MVPAVVSLVASKGRDTYSGLIQDLACFKCGQNAVGPVGAFWVNAQQK